MFSLTRRFKPATSEDLVVVLEQRLEASALFLQELQGLLLQQPGHLAHRETAWRQEKWWKTRRTKEREEVFQRSIRQYSAHTADRFESMSKNRKEKHALYVSAVCGAEVWRLKAAPTRCQSNQRASHRCFSHRPPESVTHRRRAAAGTVILDTREQTGGTIISSYVTRTFVPAGPCLWAACHEIYRISGFALFFFPRREFNQGWPLVCTNDNLPPLLWRIREGHTAGFLMLLCVVP